MTDTRLRAIAAGLLLLGGGVFSGCLRGPETGDLYVDEPIESTVTFWGHSTAYIDVDGFGMITDPVFDPAYGFLYRRRLPRPPFDAYDQTDLILISHAHKDHLSVETLALFPHSATVLCSPASAAYMDGLELEIVTMGLGDEYVYPHGRIVAVAAHHPGGRFSLDAEPDGRALGFVIEMPWAVVYYSGDTDYFEGFREVGERFAPDLALLNINAHLKPEDALPAIEDLGSPLVVPMHYGAYNSINELRAARWHDELEEGIGPRLIRLPVGGSLALQTVRARRREIAGGIP